MPEKSTYMLSDRDEQKQESERLEHQYSLLKHAFSGRLLHSSISPLEGNSAIADIGTGTGAWINDLARSFPTPTERDIRFVGFDISPAKYPSANEKGVELVVHDITTRFPAKYHGKFDVVHLRLLVYAIREEDVVGVVENVTELLRPGGYLQWQDTDLNDIWATPASSIISQAINNVNLERSARELSLFMPGTIIKALLALQLPVEIPILELPGCSRNVLRILAMETISTAEITPSEEIKKAGRDLLFDTLLILLHAATVRKQASRVSNAVTVDQEELAEAVGQLGEGKGDGELENQVRELSVEGSLRLNNKFTWIVAQKTAFPIQYQ